MARSRMPRIPCAEGSAPGRQPATVIADGQHGPGAVLVEPQFDPGRLGVPGDVRQRLLRDAVDHELLLLATAAATARAAARPACCACSPNEVASAASALCNPRSSSASGRSCRAMRRTSSVPLRAVSRSSSSCVPQLVGDPRGQPFDLQHGAGQRLADLVVQLAGDPAALALQHAQRLTRALASLGLQPIEHLVERLRQRRDIRLAVDRHPLARARADRAGASLRPAHRAGGTPGATAGGSRSAPPPGRSPAR